jgi:hypothetical protein
METEIELMLMSYEEGVPLDMPRTLVSSGLRLVGARRTVDQVLLVVVAAANDDCAGPDRAPTEGKATWINSISGSPNAYKR